MWKPTLAAPGNSSDSYQHGKQMLINNDNDDDDELRNKITYLQLSPRNGYLQKTEVAMVSDREVV